MRAAVILLWAGGLWSIARWALWLVFAAPPWRRLAVLAVLALAASACHTPRTTGKNIQ